MVHAETMERGLKGPNSNRGGTGRQAKRVRKVTHCRLSMCLNLLGVLDRTAQAHKQLVLVTGPIC